MTPTDQERHERAKSRLQWAKSDLVRAQLKVRQYDCMGGVKNRRIILERQWAFEQLERAKVELEAAKDEWKRVKACQ